MWRKYVLKSEYVLECAGSLDEVRESVLSIKQQTNKDGNMGLGLSMVKLIADKLGANITVKSRLGEGTTYTLVLPKNNQ